MYSLDKLIKDIGENLILNPVENLPLVFGNASIAELQGLYITDKNRTDVQKTEAKILFGGRDNYIDYVLRIYDLWKTALGAEDITMRPQSGLNAHLLMFLGLGIVGDKVMLLPEEGGGHFSTHKILSRIGFKIVDIPLDYINNCIDIKETIKLQQRVNCKFLFIDRSEGLIYEDLTELCSKFNGYKIFDASQYLTNIIYKQFKSPFDMGFDLIISTLHKNFPGPQKALICTNNKTSNEWLHILNTMRDCVSNIHADKIIQSGIILKNPYLKIYSNDIVSNAIELEKEFEKLGIPVITRNYKKMCTHHLWIKLKNKNIAYTVYKNLEKCGILVNYRLLPYNIGYGLRLGTNCATIQGLTPQNIPQIAQYFAEIISGKYNINDIHKFIKKIIYESDYNKRRLHVSEWQQEK